MSSDSFYLCRRQKHVIHAFDRGVLISGATHFHSVVMHELALRNTQHTFIKRQLELKGSKRLNVNRNIDSLLYVCTCPTITQDFLVVCWVYIYVSSHIEIFIIKTGEGGIKIQCSFGGFVQNFFHSL